MKKQLVQNIMAYFCTPLLYCMTGLLLSALIIYPFVKNIVSVMMLVIEQQIPVSSQEETEKDKLVSLSDVTDGILKAEDVRFPSYGEKLGSMSVSGSDGEYIKTDIYFGDDTAQLKNGVGIYPGSTLPGFGSTVLAAGHNHTWFKPLKHAVVGDTITITTYYGVYVYEISDIQIKQTTDTTHYDLLADHENLVMYTCYPFGSIGMTPTRYFIYGKYISGPMINTRG